LGANVSAGARNTRQFGFNASGGVVVFDGGAVFTPELGETVAVVQAKDAAGARVTQATGVRLDGHGLAVVPYLQPYRENTVTLDPKGVSTDVTLENVGQKVVPTHGAVVLLQYPTRHGFTVLVKLRRSDASPLPFAVGVFDGEDQNVGYVVQGQQALVRVSEAAGELTVRWGAGDDEQCRFSYDLAMLQQTAAKPQGDADKFRRLEATCF